MNIKNRIKYLSFVLTISSASFSAQSQNIDNIISLTTYKCHVSLISGEETIHFLSTKKVKLNQVAGLLSGRKVASSTSGELFNIYEVIECAGKDTKFINKKSRKLEAKIPR